ncbi:nucleoside recognition domain-containing protein [Desulfobacterales bacterium HSG16]|nr:nucleoside recognition domain-containing protein [Desulfobacterales bacterium HSG16]
MNRTETKKKLKSGFLAGTKKGWSGFLWMLKILVPISFGTLLIEYSGIIEKMDFLLAPFMHLMNLPSAAALPIIVGMLTSIYGAIAAMSVLPLATEHMTLIAIFLLISHGLIQEGIIQAKSGIHWLKTTLIRLSASFITVMIASRIIKVESVTSTTESIAAAGEKVFTTMLTTWCIDTSFLMLKIFCIIMPLMMALEIMKRFEVIPLLVKFMSPFIKMMGLDKKVGILWLTANTFGIAYGASVIVEETRDGSFTAEELTRLHISIGINHAMIEDPALFLSLGLNPLWLWIPRLATAIAATHLYNIWLWLCRQKNKNRKKEQKHQVTQAEQPLTFKRMEKTKS